MTLFAFENFRDSEPERWTDNAVDECGAVARARKVQVLRRVHA